MKRKKFKDLTIKDNFMFSAVMMNEELCKKLLEIILGFPIEKVQVCREKSIIYHPEYKGVRLDVYAKDEKNTHFDVEMQSAKGTTLEKRSRYYHSQMDMELLASGDDYSELPDTYVIFICDFDPFGKGRYKYSFKNCCIEDGEVDFKDGKHSIFLNTRGKEKCGVSEELIRLLNYIRSDLKEATNDFEDEFVKELQETVLQIKSSREMEEQYMHFGLALRDERVLGRAEGKAEAVLELLSELDSVPDEIRQRIMGETDITVLNKWLKSAAKANTIDQFIKSM